MRKEKVVSHRTTVPHRDAFEVSHSVKLCLSKTIPQTSQQQFLVHRNTSTHEEEHSWNYGPGIKSGPGSYSGNLPKVPGFLTRILQWKHLITCSMFSDVMCLILLCQDCFQLGKLLAGKKHLGLMLVKIKCSLSLTLEQYSYHSCVITYFVHNSHHIVNVQYVGLQCGVRSESQETVIDFQTEVLRRHP